MKRYQASALLFLIIGLIAAPSWAAQWNANVGAQSNDMGRQAMSFLPNEMWIHAGDSITWTFAANEIHTVTFLVANEVRPPFPVGCPPGPPPGITPSGSNFDGTQCVNAGPSVAGQNYTVKFPVAGNFKLVCLVHPSMTGVIHVLDSSTPLPHDQAFYDHQATLMRIGLLSDFDLRARLPNSANGVTAGTGETMATPGGHVNLAVVRFTNATIHIRAGQTVEWGNSDPETPHTITFGTEPAGDPTPPSSNVTTDADGALHATINSTSDSVHSGFIVAEPQERTGLAQTPPATTRFRVTFTHAGIYPYICALHDDLGMRGQVIVSN